jgi:hypothetical protein
VCEPRPQPLGTNEVAARGVQFSAVKRYPGGHRVGKRTRWVVLEATLSYLGNRLGGERLGHRPVAPCDCEDRPFGQRSGYRLRNTETAADLDRVHEVGICDAVVSRQQVRHPR